MYPRGSEGVDFDANLAITTLDFGTFHVRQVSLTITLLRLTKDIYSHTPYADSQNSCHSMLICLTGVVGPNEQPSSLGNSVDY